MPACHVRRLSAQSGTLECISSKAWTRWLFQFLGWFGKHTKLKLHNLEVEQLKPLKKWMGKEGHDPFGSFWVSWNLPTKGAPQRLSASAPRLVWPEFSSLTFRRVCRNWALVMALIAAWKRRHCQRICKHCALGPARKRDYLVHNGATWGCITKDASYHAGFQPKCWIMMYLLISIEKYHSPEFLSY